MDAGNPFLQFGLLVQVVIAFVGLFVLRPVPGIATVEPNIAEVSRQLCGVSHQPPQLGLIHGHINVSVIRIDFLVAPACARLPVHDSNRWRRS
jgi:hypothetical protein